MSEAEDDWPEHLPVDLIDDWDEAGTARALANVFVAGPLEAAGMRDRAARLFGRRMRWVPPLAKRVEQHFATGPRARLAQVIKFLRQDEGFLNALWKYRLTPVSRIAPPEMAPLPAARLWQVPPLCDVGELADWLGLSIRHLEWLADGRGLAARHASGPLVHYRYRVLSKRFGKIRLIEAPKAQLKQVQRKILDELLAHVPPHPAARGFLPGHSIRTFAGPHVGQAVVLRIDLEDFFPSIRQARIAALFRTLGYPEPVADLLAGLCTNAAPPEIWDDVEHVQKNNRHTARWLYAQPHLPQGAPTSPALANLCAYRLDCRLAGLARAAGATYTRYADDLAFSGGAEFDSEFVRGVKRFQTHVCATVLEEGFRVHHRKTRIMRRGTRQHLAGLVVNRRLNIRRRDYDVLKATLTNCIRNGPASQNRAGVSNFRAHLLGRVAYVEMIHPAHGEKLRTLFEQIVW